ncbi:DMT family transporter [Methylobacterium organophilum]|uniref:DMT family transporter n=1 Tax=Methylobacterium organophilum TaxID=410 RepID=UPI001F13A4B4|nr:DMT family transporter [Methylobacterium organophilum]UMY18922.1 DMT family transporter [Methylobacterium organophilum]
MDPATLGLVLLAAFLHAAWNTLLRGGADRLWSMAVMNLVMGLAGLAGLLAYGLPAPASWPCAVASGALHLAYNLLLVATYRTGDLGQTYPIARGSSPAMVTLGAGFAAGEHPGLLATCGIVLVSGGILSLARERGGLGRATLMPALATGVAIGGYTLVDGIGVRQGGDWRAYAAAMFVFHLILPSWLALRRGTAVLRVPAPEMMKAAGGGVISFAAYAAVVWAMQRGAMGAVSALRETSVVFAALLGRIVLGERLTPHRIAACLVIALGAAAIGSA